MERKGRRHVGLAWQNGTPGTARTKPDLTGFENLSGLLGRMK
jgi:hypothetical protein